MWKSLTRGTSASDNHTMDELTASQKFAVDFLLHGSGNGYIGGPPGTGKSYLLKYMQDYLTDKRVKHATIAPRGACAYIVRGDTIHSKVIPFDKNQNILKTAEEMCDALRRALKGQLGGGPNNARAKKRNEFWKGLDVLFIDEVFLVDAGLLAMTDLTARAERCDDRSFGGLRVFLLGDPCQMGPRGESIFHPFRPVILQPKTVVGEDSDSDDENDAWGVSGRALFDRRTITPWADAQPVVFDLVENVRQAGDPDFRRLLSSIRAGISVKQMPPDVRALLMDRCVEAPPDDVFVLYWARDDAARRNKEMNDRLGGDVIAVLGVSVKGQDGGDLPKRPALEAQRELNRLAEDFVKTLPTEGEVVLRANTRVMLLANIDVKAGAYRGAAGIVKDVARDGTTISSITVLLDTESVPFVIKPQVEKIDHENLSCKVSYFPISYGYAGTYDSAQGKTLNSVACAVTPRMPRGMFYVGISRVRERSNLYIVANVNRYNSVADAKVILLENPNIVKNDPHVDAFLAKIERARSRAKKDADVFSNIKRRGALVPTSAVCSICGGQPEVLLQPCNHLAACWACWNEATGEGAATCPACSTLVTSVTGAKLCFVSLADIDD